VAKTEYDHYRTHARRR